MFMYYMYIWALYTKRVRILLPSKSQFPPIVGNIPPLRMQDLTYLGTFTRSFRELQCLGLIVEVAGGSQTKKRKEHSSQ